MDPLSFCVPTYDRSESSLLQPSSLISLVCVPICAWGERKQTHNPELRRPPANEQNSRNSEDADMVMHG